MIKAGGFTEQLFVDLHGEYGDVVRFFMGPTMLNFSVSDPELVHELYRKGRDRPLETYLFLWYLGKENLMFQKGEIVKKMRSRYGTMISERSQLDKLHEVSMREFRATLEKWSSPANAPAKSIDLHAALGPLIYDVMGGVMFDAPWLSTEIGQEIYRLHKKLIMEVNRWVLFPVGPIFHPAFIDYLMTIRKWRALVGSLLDSRAKEMRENPKKFENDESAIHMILTSKDDDGTPFFSRGRAISTMCGFLNGAYDTTHATSYWLIFYLAKYPECQAKILDEFNQVLGGITEPSMEDLRKCNYLHAFLQEGMRHRATVPVNMRVNLSEDVKLGKYIIPAGSNVNIPNGVIFKDERWFGAQPLGFRPERFIGDSPEADRARRAWFPFGEHTRMCVGFTFALTEMKAMIYNVLARSTVELEDPNENGDIFLEAGVNQPLRHAKFIFRQRDMRKMREEENLKWWMQQIDALEKIKSTGGSVAQVA